MPHRNEPRIIFDMLKALEQRDSPMKLRELFDKAKVRGVEMQVRYLDRNNEYSHLAWNS